MNVLIANLSLAMNNQIHQLNSKLLVQNNKKLAIAGNSWNSKSKMRNNIYFHKNTRLPHTQSQKLDKRTFIFKRLNRMNIILIDNRQKLLFISTEFYLFPQAFTWLIQQYKTYLYFYNNSLQL